MSDNKRKEDGREDSKIDSNDGNELEYAARKFGVTPEQINDAISKVDNSRIAVQKYLGK